MKNQRGIALPIALIMFVVMLMGGLYLARSVGSSSIMVGNMAYQRVLSRISDRGLLRAYDWLGNAQSVNKVQLDNDVAAQGYVAAFSFADPQLGPEDAAFWNGSITVINFDGKGNDIQYVINRMCQLKLAFSAAGNNCVTSSFDAAAGGAATGTSLDTGSGEPITGQPLIHYLITSRVINTRKGTTAINQLVVMMGA